MRIKKAAKCGDRREIGEKMARVVGYLDSCALEIQAVSPDVAAATVDKLLRLLRALTMEIGAIAEEVGIEGVSRYNVRLADIRLRNMWRGKFTRLAAKKGWNDRISGMPCEPPVRGVLNAKYQPEKRPVSKQEIEAYHSGYILAEFAEPGGSNPWGQYS